jgi:ABC-type branched-subunit amino acid transport system substrate-binding protein
MSDQPVPNGGQQTAPNGGQPEHRHIGCKYPSGWWSVTLFLIQGIIVAAVVSVVASLFASYIWLRKYERRLTTISVPVFIRGQDAQGGQFALGVMRAMDHAERHAMSDVDGRRVEPVFLDEDIALKQPDGVARLMKRIKDLKAPIVVGPLTSSAAKKLVPKIAGELHIPMILGIPTSMTAKDGSNGYAWRLSPKNDKQAKAVARHYFAVRPHGDHLLIIQDNTDNPDYSNDLVAQLMPALNEPGRRSPEKLAIGTRGDYAELDGRLEDLKAQPLSIIYIGMPDVARDVLSKAEKLGLDATWIFTDGCITDKNLVEIASRMKKGKFFVTFQAPPAKDSPGLERYIWYVRSLGGRVSFALDSSNKQHDCAEETSASSYEVFGFDSYLLALDALSRSVEGGQNVSALSANNVLTTQKIEDPFLLLGPYAFQDGDSTNLDFHVYQIADNCVQKYATAAAAAP